MPAETAVPLAPTVLETGTTSLPAAAPSDRELSADAATRAKCLQSPLSPSAGELPELAGQRHEVRGTHGEQHIFLPPKGTPITPSRYAAKHAILTARFPDVPITRPQFCDQAAKPAGGLYCVQVEVAICEPWLPIAERLLPALSAEGLGLIVAIQGRPGPRCTGDACSPLAYHSQPEVRGDLLWSGWFTLPYRPNDARAAVRPELGRGACASDGDCVVAGCGNHCEAWQEPPHGANCPAYRELDDAYCGCVAGACSWFVQPALHAITADVRVAGWIAPAPSDGRDLESGDTVFRQLLEGPWFRRHLERAALEHKAQLPSRLTFAIELNARFKVAIAKVSIDDGKAPEWIREIFLRLPVPVPTLVSRQSPPSRVIARGKLVITSK